MADEAQESVLRPPPQSPMYAPMRMEASMDRLMQPFSRVTLWNSSTNQNHVIVDRHMQGVELRPGERRRDVEMLNEDIAHFQRQRDPSRLYDPDGKGMRPKPLHPVVIEGIGDMIADADAEQRRRYDEGKRFAVAERRAFLRRELESLNYDEEGPSEQQLRPRPKRI